MALEIHRPTRQTVGRLLTLVVISLLAAFLRYLAPASAPGSGTMLLGFLLLAAFVAGEVAREVHVPRITGYLVIGILFGPNVFGLLPSETIEDFRLINHVALSVIALQAGGELRLARIRERLKSIGMMTALQVVFILVGITAVVYMARSLLPFLAGQPSQTVLAVALIFGLVAVAKSPATTIAVITELRARGPLADTVLGVSVLKDVVVLLLIAVMLPAAVVLVDPAGGFDFEQLREISVAILLSLGLGTVVGWLIGLYLEKINLQPILFTLAVAFLVVEFSQGLGLESEMYILMSMTAGFVVQNLSVHGPGFVEALEANSLPLYALFFALAGADLALDVIPAVWQAGLVMILARAALIYVSTYMAAAAAGDRPIIRHYAWMGFLAQAGVTLGLANIVRERFALWGPDVAAIIVGMIAVNQLVGPPLFRYSLVRAKESKARRRIAPPRLT